VPADRIDPVDADRAVVRVQPTVLTPVERELERERRERARQERLRRETAGRPAAPADADAAPPAHGERPRIDVRA
jgi:hypothetical protein